MHWNSGDRQIVIADRRHSHNREEPAQHRQFVGGSDANRAMALDVESLELVVFRQAPLELRRIDERLSVDVGDERLHCAILRRFGLIHVRNRRGEHRPNRVSGSDIHFLRPSLPSGI